MAHGYVGAAGVSNEAAGSGLLQMRQRWYDPGLGKWLSQDPIGFDGGLNMSNYVGQSPINFSDPTGLYDPIRIAPNYPGRDSIDAGTRGLRPRR